MRTRILSIGAGWAAVLALGGIPAAHAQGTINATALVTGVQVGSVYDYTITLNNLSSSTAGIQTMWFAWLPGADLMPSQPSAVTQPNNWTSSVEGGAYLYNGSSYYYDGYSIEFTTQNAGSAVGPGSSATFGFTSPDSPTTLSGNSPDYPFYPIGITYVYANGAPGPGSEPGGTSSAFQAVVPVPEPSSLGLLTLGAALFFVARRKLVSRAARV